MSFYDLDASSTKPRAEQLVEKDGDGSKQQARMSTYAPSHVDDAELLARSLEYPSKFDAEGGLNDSLFQDAFSHGASAQRLPEGWEKHEVDVHTRFETRAKARREGVGGKAASPNFTYVGTFHMTAGELRNCRLPADKDDVARVRVYDAGHEASDSLHADVIADGSGLGKRQRHELRVRLMSVAEQRGLHVSPFLDEDGLRTAGGSQCELIEPSKSALQACKQEGARDLAEEAVGSLPPPRDGAV